MEKKENEKIDKIKDLSDLSFTHKTAQLLTFLLSIVICVGFFTYASMNPQLDIMENASENTFVSIFKFLVGLLPVVAGWSYFQDRTLIQMCNSTMFETVGRVYRESFEEVNKRFHTVNMVQQEALDRIKEFNNEIRAVDNKLEEISELKQTADDCIIVIDKMIESSRKLIALLETDGLLKSAHGFMNSGIQDFQKFYERIKLLKDEAEQIYNTKTKTLNKDFEALAGSIKKCSGDIKFIEERLERILTDEKIVKKVLS